jgi:zona occludens toxin
VIIWHGGLPGAGKSYEAMVTQIFPALKKGREVQVYIAGVNYTRIAECCELPEARVRELLTELTEAQVREVWKHARTNALLVIDEAQNFWDNKHRVERELKEFITMHRHQGLDLVLMGQDYRDVQVLWRRRIDVRSEFLKATALGLAKRYTVTTFKHKGLDEWEQVSTQMHGYDSKYFGCYKSVDSDGVSTMDHIVKRATVWSKPGVWFGIPFSVVLAAVSIWWLVGFFKGEKFDGKSVSLSASSAAGGAASSPRTTVVVPSAAPTVAPVASAPPPSKNPVERLLVMLDDKGRLRLAGLMQSGDRVDGVVEWVGGEARVIHRTSLNELRNLGVAVVVGENVVTLAAGGWSAVAVAWPTESSSVSRERLDFVRNSAGGVPAVGASPGPPQVVVIGDTRPAPLPVEEERPGPLVVKPSRPRS